jgi:RNA polymerase sigma factor (sigma-70 family)
MSTRTIPDADPRSDGELLAAGDGPSFGVFYDRHARAVLAAMQRATCDPDAAADLTAETFAQAYLSRRRFEDRGNGARAWLLTIARRQLSRMLKHAQLEDRARRRLGLDPLALDDESYERIEELVDTTATRESVREAMAILSPSVARALSLRVGDGLPYPQVASLLGCSEGAARVRVARGLRALERAMEVTS